MDCPSCVSKIQGDLTRLRGVSNVEGNPLSRTLTGELEPELVGHTAVRERVERLGYTANLVGDDGLPQTGPTTWQSIQARIAYVSIALFSVGLLLRIVGPTTRLFSLPLHDLHVPDLLFLASAAVGGWNFFPKGIRAARALTKPVSPAPIFSFSLRAAQVLRVRASRSSLRISFVCCSYSNLTRRCC